MKWNANPADTKKQARETIKTFCSLSQSDLPQLKLKIHKDLISETMAGDHPLAVFEKLTSLSSHSDPWIASSAQTFSQGSPTSAHLTFEQLGRAKTLTLKQCFAMEYNIAIRCCYGHDFYEGVRARLIDKDLKPNWMPKDVTQVKADLIESYFQPLN